MNTRFLFLALIAAVAAVVPGASSGRLSDAPSAPPAIPHVGLPRLDSQLVQVATTARSQGGTA